MNSWIYIHGFGSSPQGTKVTQLREYVHDNHLGTVYCKAFDYSVTDPFAVLSSLREFIEQTRTNEPKRKVLLMGSSLGGFFALQSYLYFRCPTVVLNPSNAPSVTLGRWGVSEDLLNQYRDLELKLKAEPFTDVRCFVCNDDEVISHERIEDFGFDVQRLPSGGHGMVNFPQLLPEITQYLAAR